MIKTILIDDNKNELNYLNELCLAVTSLDVVKQFTSSVKAFEWLNNNPIDLIISDIEMPMINGIDMLKQLKQKPLVILVSAHPEYALQSFEIEPVHYLIKPLKMEGLLKGIERAKDRLANKINIPEFIFVLQNKEYIKIELNSILFVKAEGNFVNVATKNGNILVLSNLTQFTKQLPSQNFMRVHKTYTVNSLEIKKYTTEHIIINDLVIPFGTSYKTDVLNRFKNQTIQRKVQAT
jgi:DNA-binding LytR/AlgR family response regulator